ncbi:MAG: DNRLRE domain-containing protein [Cyanobacteria bacterium J06642_2]
MSSERFRVIGLPDTQFYSESFPEIFLAQTQWIVDNEDALNIEFVSHYGDLVQHGTGPLAQQEYENAEAAMRLLQAADISHGMVAGNHDLLESGGILQPYDDSNYLDYFGPHWYGDSDWFGGASPSGLSTYQFFGAGDNEFLALHVHLETPHAELAWAQDIINEHRDKPVMVTTHRYLQDAEDYTGGIPIIPSGRYPEFWYLIENQYNPDGIRAEEFFNHFIYPNQNIFLVNAGHFHEEYRQTSINLHDLPVYEVLADYQDDPNGGNGWLRIMDFDTSLNRINVSSYSPTLDEFLTKDESLFSLPVEFDRYVAQNSTTYFQDGVGGYQGTEDTWINEAAKDRRYGKLPTLVADDDTRDRWLRDREGQTLLQFDGIIGDLTGQIPFGATITRADLKLTLRDDVDREFYHPDCEVYFITREWDESSTWNSLENGLAIGEDFDSLIDTFSGHNDPAENNVRYLDVREAVQRWADGDANYGLGIVSEELWGNDDGIRMFASETNQIMFRPALMVEYIA